MSTPVTAVDVLARMGEQQAVRRRLEELQARVPSDMAVIEQRVRELLPVCTKIAPIESFEWFTRWCRRPPTLYYLVSLGAHNTSYIRMATSATGELWEVWGNVAPYTARRWSPTRYLYFSPSTLRERLAIAEADLCAGLEASTKQLEREIQQLQAKL